MAILLLKHHLQTKTSIPNKQTKNRKTNQTNKALIPRSVQDFTVPAPSSNCVVSKINIESQEIINTVTTYALQEEKKLIPKFSLVNIRVYAKHSIIL